MLRLIVAVCAAFAVSVAAKADIEGAKDHPVIGRYDGAEIIAYDVQEFDEYRLMVAPATAYGGKDANLGATRSVEGAVTRIAYRAPADRSVLEVFRNYRQALAASGFTTIFECDGGGCGGRNFNHSVVPYDLVFGDYHADQRYAAARLERPEGDVYVSLYATMNRAGGGVNKDRVVVQLDVVDVAAMEADKVIVDAAAMRDALAAEGHVALAGVYFDTDAATLKPESNDALAEAATFLNDNADVEALIVGHTDNQGAIAYNQDLSQRRAAAVVDALVSDHGVAAARLTAVGVGMAAPVASNRGEPGRALNRRVEIVER